MNSGGSRLLNSWSYRAFRSFLYERLTPAGLCVFYLMLAANVLNGGSALFKGFLLACSLASALLVSVAAARWARRRCWLETHLPPRVTQGVPFDVICSVSNPGRSLARDLNLRLIGLPRNAQIEPALGPYLGSLPPGESASSSFRVTLPRRGRFVLDEVRVGTLFPFALWRDWHAHTVARSLLVYPRFQPLTSLDMPVGRKYQPGGMALTSNVGESTEFLSTREYRPGDPLKTIHWRSWARRGKPVVKEFQEEFFCRIALVLDTFIPRRQAKARRPDFEAAISLAAAVADQISRDEYVIDLFAAGPELYQLQAGRSLAYLENVLDLLACVEPCFETPFEKLEPVLLDGLENVTTTVVVLLAWDESRLRLLRSIRERGCALKVLFVGNYEPQLLAAVSEFADDYSVLSAAQVAAGVDRL